MELQRLNNGVIVTQAFLSWITSTLLRQAEDKPGKVPVFDCLRIHPDTTANSGDAFWWQIDWQPEDAPVSGCVLEPIGGQQLWFTRGARLTLRDRCLDIRDGRPCLRG